LISGLRENKDNFYRGFATHKQLRALAIGFKSSIGDDDVLRIAVLRWMFAFPETFTSMSSLSMLCASDLINIKSAYGLLEITDTSDVFRGLLDFVVRCIAAEIPPLKDDQLTITKWLEVKSKLAEVESVAA
jgi:hypothetical protein